MTGPCLCGDPYCPYCGNADPALEEWAVDLTDRLIEKNIDECEARYLDAIIFAALDAYRKNPPRE